MKQTNYSCKKRELHPELQTVWEEQEYNMETETFKDRHSSFYGLKFIFFVLLSVLGVKHYNIMGML